MIEIDLRDFFNGVKEMKHEGLHNVFGDHNQIKIQQNQTREPLYIHLPFFI